MSRRKARETGFRYIYQLAFGQPLTVENDGFWDIITSEEEPLEGAEKEFAEHIIKGVIENLEKIDSIIFSKLKDWTINRIFKIDLAVLRVAIYELIYCTDTPYKVVINEAVEISKKYGDQDSYNFINGVLREVLKEKGE